jgi:hypothetical protein
MVMQEAMNSNKGGIFFSIFNQFYDECVEKPGTSKCLVVIYRL